MREDNAPEPQRYEKQHQAHARGDAEETGESVPHAGLRPGCGQHDVAGTRGHRGDDGEQKKRRDLLRSRRLPPRSEGPFRASLELRAMRPKQTRSAFDGLEGSCQETAAGWIASTRRIGGVELFSAWFAGEAYQKHRHDTYAIGVTDSGVQVFDYRGSVQVSTPGRVIVLHPDEIHDGRAGSADGFAYRILYIEPGLLGEALRAIRGRPGPLPFVKEAVSMNSTLSQAIERAFRTPLESLAIDSLVLDLANGLLTGERASSAREFSRSVDVPAVERARRFLDAERTRVVHSTELEVISGLTRYDLCRQFRSLFGTSPHRYLLMRRLEFARDRIHHGHPLSAVACDAGFADQPHFTRVFKSAFGLTPARYRALSARGTRRRERCIHTSSGVRNSW
jgi:AraC-like DNA-binding protein